MKVIGMPHRLVSFLVSSAALVLMGTASLGQEPVERPRIGLCLAGGGARGGAHIGVLKVLEEIRVPVDYIAGTSIGAIIGGLYASGMSPAEMDSALSRMDWFPLFDDSPPRKLTSIRRKQEDRLPLFGFEVGVGSQGLKMPAGIVSGQKLIFFLRELTLSTIGTEDFDDFPIPYRAVATSLDDGGIVVLDHGAMADAMRASMAIPGAFTPHVIDGATLIDGGMLRNVPYDVVKSMGADIIIVVDVGKPIGDLDRDPSLMGVLGQTVDLTIAANAIESVKEITERDVLLVPDLEGIGAESFERMAEASDRGVAVATGNIELLKRLSLPEAEYEAWLSGMRAKRGDDVVRVGSVRIESPSRVDPRRVRRQVRSAPGQMLDLEVLAQDLSRVYRLGEFELVDYSLEVGDDAPARDLVIRTRDKRWGPNYLRIGLALEDHFEGQARFVVNFYHRMATINRLGAEWRNMAALGDLLSLDTEFYQPLTMSGLFFAAPRLSGQVDKRQRWFEPDLSELVSAKQYGGRLDLGLAVSHWGELRLGPYLGRYWATGENNSLDQDENLGGLRGGLVIDQLDDYDFPKLGWAAYFEGRLSGDDLGATTTYDRLSVKIRGAASAGRTTFFGKFEGGTSFHTELPFYDRFELGGFSRLSGYAPGRIFGDKAAVLNVGFHVRILTLNRSLKKNVYAGLAFETGQAWDHTEKYALNDLLMGGMAFLGAETLIGPFYLGYGWAEGDNKSFYALLGRTF